MNDALKSAEEPGESVTVKIDNKQTKKPDIDSFITPDQMEALSDIDTPPEVAVPELKKDDWRDKLRASWQAHQKRWIFGGGAGAIVLLAAGVFVFESLPKPSATAAAPSVSHAAKNVAPKPTTVASTLSGLQVSPDMNQKPVTGVMIENSEQARPQSGLSQANVVFEAIAEGGITRFLALFQDTAPDDIGPIRSARPYYEQWALGFDAGYAHVGGSPEALANIKAWGVRDLDQFANSGSYHRIDSRQAPHNVYTSVSTLQQLEATKGYTSSKFTGFERKTEAPSKTPNAKSVNMAISSASFNTHYDYDTASNSYKRSEAGVPHTDANGSVQIAPKVVIAMVMPYSLEADGYHSNYNTLGSGAAYIFQDGAVTAGQWNKKDNVTQFTFSDSTGKPVKLNPGQTWLTALRSSSELTYN